jgi:hypothetical protein
MALEPVWTTWRGEIFPYRDSNSDPSAVQPAGIRYTDCVIPAPSVLILIPYEAVPSCFKGTSSLSFPPKACISTTFQIYDLKAFSTRDASIFVVIPLFLTSVKLIYIHISSLLSIDKACNWSQNSHMHCFNSRIRPTELEESRIISSSLKSFCDSPKHRQIEAHCSSHKKKAHRVPAR